MSRKPNFNLVISLFGENPSLAFAELSKINSFLNLPESFWNQYVLLLDNGIEQTFPECSSIFNTMNVIRFFWTLNKSVELAYQKKLQEVIALNPSESALCTALFLHLEFVKFEKTEEGYNLISLESVKRIFTDISKKIKKENQSVYSGDLVNHGILLFALRKDLYHIEEFLDYCLWADFSLVPSENGKGYDLVPVQTDKKKNLLVLNELKQIFKKQFHQKKAHDEVSKEKHFQSIDPHLKTNEGFASSFFSNGVRLSSGTKGHTSLQMPDELSKKLGSENQEERNKANAEILILAIEQHFHYYLRKQLEEIYFPKDIINLHKLYLKFDEDKYCSLYQLFSISSVLIAFAFNMKYVFSISGDSLEILFHRYMFTAKEQNPSLDEKSLYNDFKSQIVFNWNEIEKTTNQRRFKEYSFDAFYRQFQKIAELKDLSNDDLKKIVDKYFCQSSRLPMPPLIKTTLGYFFPANAIVSSLEGDSFNRLLFDYIATDELFNPNGKPSDIQTKAIENQAIREKLFTNSIAELFKKIAAFAESTILYPKARKGVKTKTLRGDIDVAAYFPEERMLFIVQVKLSNTSPIWEKQKKRWINDRIEDSDSGAVAQIRKDFKLLSSKLGKKHVGKAFGCSIPDDVKIYPLIVTDNFYVDHATYKWGTNSSQIVTCISFFELENLITNQRINERQEKWEIGKDKKSAQLLIHHIKSNTFWSFLDQIVGNYKIEKELMVIEDRVKVRLKI